ncbi:polysaccharide biosynthesis/export family protein [Methylobacterium nigriterrae]|uniref:polysaccharide biosynthesis/export family protein n=1 Tax=Methylobacterium nigriterrae TaxID=3127512 RepID=UPI0030136AED
MRNGRRSRLLPPVGLLAICVALLAPIGPARAAYLLQSGDVLELVVAGVPELRQRSTIGVDGDVAFPLVGQIAAGGHEIGDLRTRLLNQLGSKVYQQRTNDGREVTHVIQPEEVSVSVVEYRQVYLSGDVARPGEQPFRAGMTVRQAVAVAGGFDVLRFRMNNPVLESADLRAEYESLWADYAREQARIWRVRSELGEKIETDPAELKLPVAPELMKRLITAEDNQLKTRNGDLERERKHLQDAIQTSTAQLAVLAEKRKKDEEGNQADVADFEKIRELFQRGITANVRITESRRAVLLSSTQLLQTIVEITNIERQRNDYSRQLTRLNDQRRLDLLREQQDTNVRVAQLTARLRAVGEKLLYSSTMQSQLIRGTGARPEFLVYRSGSKHAVPGNEDTELSPGDTVFVALRGDAVFNQAMQ